MSLPLIIISLFPTVRSGTNDFCPCLTQACPTFADIPYYPLSPSWSFLFEEDSYIYNSGTEGSLVLSSGYDIVKTPERRGSVLFCLYKGKCITPTFYSLPDSICASDLTKCIKGGYTFSFWTKIGVNEKARIERFYFVDYPGQGMMITYEPNTEKWLVLMKQGTFEGFVTFSGKNAERWHHITAVAYSSLYVSAFLDGEMMGNKSMISYSITAWTPVNPRFFYGTPFTIAARYWVDNFKMWSIPLTGDQIQQNYIDESTD